MNLRTRGVLSGRFLISLACALSCAAQSLTRQNVSTILGFENGTPGAFPSGWTTSNTRDAMIDNSVVHGGAYSARIERGPTSSGTYSDLQFTIPVDFAGQTIELRGFVKTENIVGQISLVLAERAAQGGTNIELTSVGGVRGTTDWKEYRVGLPAVAAAKFLTVQLFMPATGKAWFDDLQLLVDGQPIADAPTGIPSGLPTSDPLSRLNVSQILGFENGIASAFPARWGANNRSDVIIDDQVVHGGRYSARIERGSSSPADFSYISAAIPMDFAGTTIELRGFAKTENVTGSISLLIREDDTAGASINFATTQGLGVKGTTDWTEYRVSLPAVAAAKTFVIFLTLTGTGKAWFDDLQLFVDGKPIADAPDGIPGPPPVTRQSLSGILGFENGTPGAFPAGWTAIGASSAFIDDSVVHGGNYSARIERGPASSGAFSDLIVEIPVDFAGQTIELRGFVKTESVRGQVLFGVSERDVPAAAAIESGTAQVYGTTDWKEYRVSIPAVPNAKSVRITMYLEGPGKVWFDDLQLLVDGQPIADAPSGVPSGAPSGTPGSILYQLTRQNISEILGFENGTAGEFPAGWRSNSSTDVVLDDTVVHGGKYSARFDRTPSSANVFSDLFVVIPIDFAGKQIELRVFVKTEKVNGQLTIGLSESGNGSGLESNSWHFPNGGTSDWKEYRLSVPAVSAAQTLFFQLNLFGTGKVWFDDLQLLVDGQPIGAAPEGIPTGIPSSLPVPRRELPAILSFENGTPGLFPARWSSSNNAVEVIDDAVVHGGKYSARVERGPFNTGPYTLLSILIPVDFVGQTIEFRGFAKTQNLSDHVSLVILELAGDKAILKQNGAGALKGSTDWTEYRVSIPGTTDAKLLAVALYLYGTGTVWYDDLQLFVDGIPIADVPDSPASSLRLVP